MMYIIEILYILNRKFEFQYFATQTKIFKISTTCIRDAKNLDFAFNDNLRKRIKN